MYMINPKIFKAYDIRGVYPEEINEEAAYSIGRAYAAYIKKISGKDDIQVVAGCDNRISSPVLFEAVKRGITDEGADVLDVGLVTTPILYFSVAYNCCDGGIQVTSSHNPKQYNGFKVVREEAIPLSGDQGIEEIKDIAIKGSFEKQGKLGIITKKEAISDYVKENGSLEEFDIKVVVDTANSVSGVGVDQLLKNTRLKHIFSDLDGKFPNHEPDPLKEENTEALRKDVVKDKFDLGIAFDGDGDRMFLIDENGRMIPADLILALASSITLRTNPGARILYDIRCSNIVRETIEKMGGQAIMSRVGHSFIKAKMRAEDIILGGEYAGHYYAKQQGKYFFEAPYPIIFLVLKEMKDTGRSLSELIKPFEKYYHSGEINFKTEKKEETIEKIKDRFKKGNISQIDGIRIDFPDWWFSLRASNTEPLLRLVIEADTKELMEEKLEELTMVIKNS